MPALQTLDAVPDPVWLRRRLYAGDLLIVRASDPARRLVAYFDAQLREAFAPHAPPSAQFALGAEAWAERAGALRARCKRDAEARRLMVDLLTGFGLDRAATAADAVNLRCQPHAERPDFDPRHTLAAHRDTWASNVYQQINWWLPVYPLTAERTIAFMPYFWHEPIANDSADWDLEAVRAELRAARAEGRAPAVRKVPEPLEAPAPAHTLAVVPEPGDVLLFSGAHLHASVPNASGVARFNVELRSIDLGDAARGDAAPNIDGRAPHVAWHWFRRLDTGEPVAPGAATG